VQTSIFSKRLHKICLPNCSKTQLYGAVFHALLMMYSKLGHKLTNVKTARINKVLITLFAYIKCQSTELQCASINIQQAFVQNLSYQLFQNSTIWCSISCSFFYIFITCNFPNMTNHSSTTLPIVTFYFSTQNLRAT
jgi:hypothetical protein